jgi:hypothetical protein
VVVVDVRLSLARAGAATVVEVSGGLDVDTTTEFSQIVMGLHDIVGSGAVFDFTGVAVSDGAGRSTLSMVAHKFREFGHTVQLPRELDEATLSLI